MEKKNLFDSWHGDRDMKSVFPLLFNLSNLKDISLAEILKKWDVNSKDLIIKLN